MLLGIKVLLVLVALAWATNSIVQTANYSGEAGTLNTTNNQLLTTSKGFSTTTTASAAGTSCGSAISFGSGTVANTALTSGNVIFDAQVNTTASTPSNTCFTVTFYVHSNLGSSIQYVPVFLSTGGTVTANQAIDCKFDLGSASFPMPPFSYRLTVT